MGGRLHSIGFFTIITCLFLAGGIRLGVWQLMSEQIDNDALDKQLLSYLENPDSTSPGGAGLEQQLYQVAAALNRIKFGRGQGYDVTVQMARTIRKDVASDLQPAVARKSVGDEYADDLLLIVSQESNLAAFEKFIGRAKPDVAIERYWTAQAANRISRSTDLGEDATLRLADDFIRVTAMMSDEARLSLAREKVGDRCWDLLILYHNKDHVRTFLSTYKVGGWTSMATPSKQIVASECWPYWSGLFWLVCYVVSSFIACGIYVLAYVDYGGNVIGDLDFKDWLTWLGAALVLPWSIVVGTVLLAIWLIKRLATIARRSYHGAVEGRCARLAAQNVRIVAEPVRTVEADREQGPDDENEEPDDLGGETLDEPVDEPLEPESPAKSPDMVFFSSSSILGLREALKNQGVMLFPLSVKVDDRALNGFAVEAGYADLVTQLGWREHLGLSHRRVEGSNITARMHKYKSVDTSCSSDYSVSEEVVSSYARLLLDVAARLGLTKARCRLVSPESPNAVAAFPGPEGIEVLVHAVPGREAKEVEYPSLFGYSSRGDRPFKSYAPAEIGQVVCDSAGQPVAEVVGRTVYCLYDPGDLSESWSDEVFVRALLEAAAVMRRTTHDAEIQEIWNLYGREQSRHAYSGFAREMLREKHDDLKERLAECEQSIRDDGQSLNKAVCARENVLAEIRQLAEVDETKEVERLAKEFDSICRSSKVVGIRLDGDKLVVDTSMIIVPYRGRRYAIGRFRIIVSQNGHLQFHNLENLHATGARMHPHIHMDGNACFGSLSDGMYKLAAKRNYSALITIALQFLEAEPADGGHLGKVWEWKEIKQ